jgi:hypothetical protein
VPRLSHYLNAPSSSVLPPSYQSTVSWRLNYVALASWKRRFFGAFFDTVFWRVNLAMRVAIYARVSTKDKGQDTKNQLH